MPCLECKLSYLREIQTEDYEKIINWINDPIFNKFLYQGWTKISKEGFAEQVIDEKHKENAKIFSQFDKSSKELVGWCGIYFPTSLQHRNAKKAEIRSFVGTEFWGKGYGTEQYIVLVKFGFEKLSLNRMYFGTHQDNKGTQNIYKKLGFKLEGVSRQDYKRNEYADVFQYAILKSEYENGIKQNFKLFY